MNCKKALATLLAVALTLCAAACTKKDDTSSQAPSASTNQIEVDVYQYKAEAGETLVKAAKAFMDANPDIKINLTTMEAGKDYRTELMSVHSTGSAPDIFNIAGAQEMNDWSEKLEDLSTEPWVANAVDGSLSAVSEGEKIYGLPYGIEGYGFVYNKAIFETAGIETNALETYKDIEAAMKQLKTKIDAGELKEKYPALEAVTEIPAKETYTTGVHTLNLALAGEFAGAADAYGAANVSFTNAEALRRLYDLQADYSKYANDRSKLNEVDYAAQVTGGLATERVAMVQQGNWIYNDVAAVNKDVARNLDMLPLPLNGVTEDSISVGVPMYWCVNTDSTEPEKTAAKKFLNWLYQSEEGKRIVIDELGLVPAFTNYDGLEPADPLGKAVKRYAEAGKTLPWVFTGFPADWGQNVFGTNVQKYYSGEMTWDSLIEDAKLKWQEARKSMADMTPPDEAPLAESGSATEAQSSSQAAAEANPTA
ncbi:MAG: ABC transporter substrate-binding protein [Hydrogenoanaerobacterium sp.]